MVCRCFPFSKEHFWGSCLFTGVQSNLDCFVWHQGSRTKVPASERWYQCGQFFRCLNCVNWWEATHKYTMETKCQRQKASHILIETCLSKHLLPPKPRWSTMHLYMKKTWLMSTLPETEQFGTWKRGIPKRKRSSSNLSIFSCKLLHPPKLT